jgi:hypothetical protein
VFEEAYQIAENLAAVRINGLQGIICLEKLHKNGR